MALDSADGNDHGPAGTGRDRENRGDGTGIGGYDSNSSDRSRTQSRDDANARDTQNLAVTQMLRQGLVPALDASGAVIGASPEQTSRINWRGQFTQGTGLFGNTYDPSQSYPDALSRISSVGLTLSDLPSFFGKTLSLGGPALGALGTGLDMAAMSRGLQQAGMSPGASSYTTNEVKAGDMVRNIGSPFLGALTGAAGQLASRLGSTPLSSGLLGLGGQKAANSAVGAGINSAATGMSAGTQADLDARYANAQNQSAGNQQRGGGLLAENQPRQMARGLLSQYDPVATANYDPVKMPDAYQFQPIKYDPIWSA